MNVNLNRRFIGIDINPEALEATRTNISLNLYVETTPMASEFNELSR